MRSRLKEGMFGSGNVSVLTDTRTDTFSIASTPGVLADVGKMSKAELRFSPVMVLKSSRGVSEVDLRPPSVWTVGRDCRALIISSHATHGLIRARVSPYRGDFPKEHLFAPWGFARRWPLSQIRNFTASVGRCCDGWMLKQLSPSRGILESLLSPHRCPRTSPEASLPL